jgi:hypothetical protein
MQFPSWIQGLLNRQGKGEALNYVSPESLTTPERPMLHSMSSTCVVASLLGNFHATAHLIQPDYAALTHTQAVQHVVSCWCQLHMLLTYNAQCDKRLQNEAPAIRACCSYW